MEQKIVIIGAGPTGLGAGYRLKELGYKNFQIYERSGQIGGLASSFTDPAGFTWDIGGHVMFSHYKYYDQCFEDLMGKDFQLNNRECWVRMFDTWVPYPFQNNIRHLPKEVTYECLAGLVKAQAKGDHKSATNFREFIDRVFGGAATPAILHIVEEAKLTSDEIERLRAILRERIDAKETRR